MSPPSSPSTRSPRKCSPSAPRRSAWWAARRAAPGRAPGRVAEGPRAAAIGAGLPVMEPHGCMIVDIGGGTTEVAVIALGGIVVSTSIRVAGDEMDQEIIAYARQVHNMRIGERMAEKIKIQAGSAFPLDEEETIEIRGRDLATGLPKAVEVSTVGLRDALSGS